MNIILKNLILPLLVGSLAITALNCHAADTTNNETPTNPAFVMCTKNNRTCTIGEYTLTGTTEYPLYVRDGIVCTHDRKICTNGYQQIIASKSQPVYIAEDSSAQGKFIMCTSNKKLCAIGKHTLRGSDSQPLYIGNGVLCTASRKKCTNGFRIMHSSTPMY